MSLAAGQPPSGSRPSPRDHRFEHVRPLEVISARPDRPKPAVQRVEREQQRPSTR